MAKLIYYMNCSLDGYVEDENGRFDWSEPDQETHEFINDLVRPVGVFLNGRRMYEVMTFWENPEAFEDEPPYIRDFGEIWRAAEKVVYSHDLGQTSSSRTRIERSFEPDAVRRMKAESAMDLAIAGPDIAAQAVRAGLVDEYALMLYPVIIGGGKAMLPDGARAELRLIEERRFGNGTVFLRYSAGK